MGCCYWLWAVEFRVYVRVAFPYPGCNSVHKKLDEFAERQ